MDRLKTKEDVASDASKWVWDPNKLWKWLQDFAESNARKLVNNLFISSGVFYYGTQNKLELTSSVKNGAFIDLTIEAGASINTDGNMIILPSQIVSGTIAWPSDGTWYVWLEHKLSDDTNVAYEVNRLPESYAAIQVHQIDDYDVMLGAAWPTGAQLDKSIKIASLVVSGGSTATPTDARDTATMFAVPAAAWTWIFDTHTELTKDGTTASAFQVNGEDMLTTGNWAAPLVPLNLVLITGIEGDDFAGGKLFTFPDSVDSGVDLTPSKCWIRAQWGIKGNGTWIGDTFDPGATMISGAYDKVGNQYYYLWSVTDQQYFSIESNTASIITVTTGQGQSPGSTDFTVGPRAHTYEIQTGYRDGNNALVDGSVRTYRVEYSEDSTPQDYLKEHIIPGIKVTVRVRALHGPVPGMGTPSGWTSWVDLVSGYGAAPVMTELTVDSIDSGVVVSWAAIPGIAGYRAVYTLDGGNPDRTNPNHTKTEAVSTTSVTIPAQPGQIVRVGVWGFDQLGQMSSDLQYNDLVNGNVAGGVLLGEYSHQIALNNKAVTTTAAGAGSSPGVGRYLGMVKFNNPASIKELAIVCEAINLNSATQAQVRMYAQGAEGDAINITFDSVGQVDEPLDVLLNAGWIIFDAYDPANEDPRPSFTVDIYVGYRFGEIRPIDRDEDIGTRDGRRFRKDL